MIQIRERSRWWLALGAVILALCVLSAFTPATALGGDADGRKIYAKFANHFSMVYMRTGKLQHSIAEMQSTDLPAITAIRTSDPRIQEARRAFQMMMPFYVTSDKLYKKGQPTVEDFLKVIKGSPEMIKAGWNNDTEKQAKFLAQELVNGMNRQGNIEAAKALIFPTLSVHVRAWEKLIPLCESNAGAESDKKTIKVWIYQQRSPKPISFRINNSSGVDLHNVTLHINSKLAVSDMDGARKHYIFIPTWKAGEWIDCPPYLVDSLIRVPQSSIKTAGCMNYSLWCDELRQTGVLNLVFGRLTQYKQGSWSVHELNNAKK